MCENGTRHDRQCPNRARWLCGLSGEDEARKICPVHLSPYLESLWHEAAGPDLMADIKLHVVRLP